MFFFVVLCKRSAKCDMGHILYYLIIELDHGKCDSQNVTLALQHMDMLCYNSLRV